MSATQQLGIALTCAPSDADRTTVALIFANAALSKGQKVVLFLMLDAIYLGVPGRVAEVNEPGLSPLTTQWDEFLANGGEIWACKNCAIKRGLSASDLIDGVQLRGSPDYVEWISQGTATMSF